jgi:hypothetical protein
MHSHFAHEFGCLCELWKHCSYNLSNSFQYFIMFCFSSSKWKPLRGILVSGLQKYYTELNLVILTVLWHWHLFVGLKSHNWRCYVGNWLCSEQSYCTDKYLVFCDKHTAINILKFEGRIFGFCVFGSTRFKWGNMNTAVQHDFYICAAHDHEDWIFSLHNLVFCFWVISRHPICPGFPGTVLFLWGWKIFVPAAWKIWFRVPNVPWFPSHKSSMFLTMHMKVLTFPWCKKSSIWGGQPSASYEHERIEVGEEDV